MTNKNISKNNLFRIVTEYRGTIIENGKKYYFKRNVDNVELVMERISNLIGLKCAHYESIEVSGRRCYLSEALDNDGNFYTAEMLNIEGESLFEIHRRLFTLFKDKANALFYDVVKMYILDILFINYDRNNDNWGVIANKDPQIGILDNDLSFMLPRTIISSRQNESYFKRSKLEQGRFNVDSIKDLEYFLNNYDFIYVDLFYKIYELLTPEAVEEIIYRIEQEKDVIVEAKEVYLERYTDNYKKIGKLLEISGKLIK